MDIELQERDRIHFVGVNETPLSCEEKVIAMPFPAQVARSAMAVTSQPGLSRDAFSRRFWA
ncbi:MULTISPECIES: hypothetical protein [Stenotrophomonas]|uniref:Uncharacterized protein n=1 Tax=Stenotrophomonas maltophilia TaxID=40324 RepID=A0AAD0BTE7_STEMA|nr:hypothetical protein [Stenotrophomonas maltophilia]AUI07860.1 hypothetical protein SmaCSM2_11975 [Stenotrophomonas maltophilia]EKU9975315.1 hypothetical protein [Stenotrophomonas maltophilia]MBA2128214.1 hypothetical protein [Stenotrophomonas maltophilia]MBH1680469.1 hypothetical protein [Stenotrophomonas maltophilia]MBH1874860.1 hypothetical protein [Stenotrophomonas maltophilia]